MKQYILSIVFFGFSIASSYIYAGYNIAVGEIYIDGTDEWIEIINKGDETFSGSLSLYGAKSNPLTPITIQTTINPLNTIIIGDNLDNIDNTSISTIQHIYTGRALGLTDTSAISLRINQNGQDIDTVDIGATIVTAYDNLLTSLQSLWINNIRSWTGGNYQANNMKTGYFGNPGTYIDTVDTSSPSNTGQSNMGTRGYSGDIRISELHIHDNIYGDYLEIIPRQSMSISVYISGSCLVGTFDPIPISLIGGERYIVTNTTSGRHHTSNIITIPGWTLSTGDCLILDTAGNILDSISFSGSIQGQGSRYTNINNTTGSRKIELSGGYIYQDYRIMDIIKPISPGFDDIYLAYMSNGSISLTTITNTPSSCPNTGGNNTSGQSGQTQQNNTGSSISGEIWTSGHYMSISLIDYDPVGTDTNNERIGLTSLSGDITLNANRYILYDGKKYAFTSGVVNTGQTTIVTGNFVFVQSRTICVSLYYKENMQDIVCYDPTKDASPVIYSGGIIIGSGLGNTTTGQSGQAINGQLIRPNIQIKTVVYDPVGDDSDRETITLLRADSAMTGYASGLLLDNLRLRIGTKTKRIYGTISSGETKTLIGNFQMSNSNHTCIALMEEEYIYDEYCYNPAITSNGYISSSNTNQSTSNETTKKTNEPQKSILSSGDILRIVNVVYNPEGRDTENESITFYASGAKNMPLRELDLIYNKTKTYHFSGIINASGFTTITGNFLLPNSIDTCIDIVDNNKKIDTYYYFIPRIDKDIDTQTGSRQDKKNIQSNKKESTLPITKKDLPTLLALFADDGNIITSKGETCFSYKRKHIFCEPIKAKVKKITTSKTKKVAKAKKKTIAKKTTPAKTKDQITYITQAQDAYIESVSYWLTTHVGTSWYASDIGQKYKALIYAKKQIKQNDFALEINNHTIPYTNIDVIAQYLPQIQHPTTQSFYTSANRPYTPNRYAVLSSDSPFLFL